MHDAKKLNELEGLIAAHESEPYACQSRAHKLNQQDIADCTLYVKREDELGFLSTGSKVRKYRSLVAQLKKEKMEYALLIGGANSNHIAAFSLLLKENGIKPYLFLRKSYQKKAEGAALITLSANHDIQELDRSEWPHVLEIAHQKLEALEKAGYKAKVIPEGAFCEEGFLGALTLATDIVRNEAQLGISFDHILVDAGTGFQAAALYLGLGFIKHSAKCHILLLAEESEQFEKRLGSLSDLLKFEAQDKPFYYRPSLGKSFGSMPKAIIDKARSILSEEGILLDPLYGAKLFYEMPRIAKNLSGNILLINSGGGLSLLSYL